MKKYMKSYHVFLSSRLFQVAVYVAYPLTVMFCVLLLLLIVRDMGMEIGVGYQLSANLLLAGEIICGFLVFGGIAAKDTNKLEYLKTSAKGMPVLKNAMMAEAVRRILCVTLIQWIPLVMIGEKADESIWMANAMILLFAEICCWLVRKNSSMVVLFAIMVGGTSVLAPLLALTMMIARFLWPIALCYVLALTLLSLNIKITMKRARESFYDVRFEEKSEIA